MEKTLTFHACLSIPLSSQINESHTVTPYFQWLILHHPLHTPILLLAQINPSMMFFLAFEVKILVILLRIYTTLKRAAIHTFRDDDEIKRGHGLGPEIVKAIQNSRASIVVLSQNYAKSTWCLEELSLILEQKRTCNHFVLPVFYQVDPSDVRNQRHSFAIESNEGIKVSKWTEVNVNRWTLALREVANLTGMVASGYAFIIHSCTPSVPY